MFLRISLITLISSLFVINFSFADFRSEIDKCYKSQWDIQKCEDKAHKKYTVPKNTACKYKDWLYQLPIEAKRPNRKTITSQFYKYKNTLYYPISLDYLTGWAGCLDGMEYYLYSYNCSTKRSIDSNIEVPYCWIEIIQGNKNEILLSRIKYEWWDMDSYLMLDTKNMLMSTLDIIKFSGFDKYKQYIKWKLEYLFNNTKEKLISAWHPTKVSGWVFSGYRKDVVESNFPNNSYNWRLAIKNVNKNFIWYLYYSVSLWDYSKNSIWWAKIDFLNKKITIIK